MLGTTRRTFTLGLAGLLVSAANVAQADIGFREGVIALSKLPPPQISRSLV